MVFNGLNEGGPVLPPAADTSAQLTCSCVICLWPSLSLLYVSCEYIYIYYIILFIYIQKYIKASQAEAIIQSKAIEAEVIIQSG